MWEGVRGNIRALAVPLGPGVEPHITSGGGPSEKRLFFFLAGGGLSMAVYKRMCLYVADVSQSSVPSLACEVLAVAVAPATVT